MNISHNNRYTIFNSTPLNRHETLQVNIIGKFLFIYFHCLSISELQVVLAFVNILHVQVLVCLVYIGLHLIDFIRLPSFLETPYYFVDKQTYATFVFVMC